MTIKTLAHTPPETIINCLLECFEGYFVKMPEDHDYYHKRWEQVNVLLDHSYGMFDGNKLIAFIINAIDERENMLTAYNTGTGVLPAYRGKNITKLLYNKSLKDLKSKGISRCTLEVITKNSPAIKAYKSVGFLKTKTLKCFKGEINMDTDLDFTIKKTKVSKVPKSKWINQNEFSWDNHYRVLKTGHTYHEVRSKEEAVGYFVGRDESNYMAQINVFQNSDSHWNMVFSAIKSLHPSIRINNVDELLTDKIRYLKLAGLVNTIDQYQMDLNL